MNLWTRFSSRHTSPRSASTLRGPFFAIFCGGWLAGLFASALPAAAFAQAPTAPPQAAVAPNSTLISRPLSTWTAISIAIPRGGVPRHSLIALAATLSASTGETDGTLAAVRARGGQIEAEATADGLVVDVGGARADAPLLLQAALSVLDGLRTPDAAIESALRPLRRLDPPSALERARARAWFDFFSRAPPHAALSPAGAAEMIAQEVRAAALSLDRGRAFVVVESAPEAFGPDEDAARNTIARAVSEKVASLAFLGASPADAPALPAPATVAPPQPGAPYLVAQPLPFSVAADPLRARLFAIHLQEALFGAPKTRSARFGSRTERETPGEEAGEVWIEATAAAALLFIRPPDAVSFEALQESLRNWQKARRFSKSQLDVAATILDAEHRELFDVGATAHLWAERALLAPPVAAAPHLGVQPQAMDAANVRALLEEFPLHVFPDHLRVFGL